MIAWLREWKEKNPPRLIVGVYLPTWGCGRPLEDDGEDDIKGYNEELEALGDTKWFTAPWLFIECYMYR